MNPTPDIDIGELRKLEKAANAAYNSLSSRHFNPDEAAYYTALRNAAPPLLAAAEAKDAAYHERDMLVAALSKCFPSYLARHSDEDKTWEDDWRWIVYINIPVREQVVFGDMHDVIPESQWFKTSVRQVSWHIHDSEREMFRHLEVRENNWDGHNTERKYQRLAALQSMHLLAAAEECGRQGELLAELYQVIGAISHYTGLSDHPDIIRVMDRLAYDDAPKDSLLPFPKIRFPDTVNAAAEECAALKYDNANLRTSNELLTDLEVDLRAEIAALKSRLVAAEADIDTLRGGLGGCESCGTPFVSDDDGVSMGDVYFCTKCYAEWKAEYDACEHDWEPMISIGEPRVCGKCNGYEPELSTYEGKSE